MEVSMIKSTTNSDIEDHDIEGVFSSTNGDIDLERCTGVCSTTNGDITLVDCNMECSTTNGNVHSTNHVGSISTTNGDITLYAVWAKENTSTTPNPKTGVLTHSLFALLVVISMIFGCPNVSFA